MKDLIKSLLVVITLIISVKLIAGQKKVIVEQVLFKPPYRNVQDTEFIKNYIRADKIAYLYTEPNLASKTKVKIPKNVMITTIKRVGDFEYGDFNVSSTNNYKGWFLISDLKGIMFTPPKVDQ